MSIAPADERRRAAWNTAWQALGARADGLDALLSAVLACYREPHRHYHTVQHLDECFERLAPLRDRAAHPAEVEVALWFHDAVYDVQRHDNEARSATWAVDALTARGVGAAAAQRVHRLVMATRHSAPTDTPDETLLVDVDLSILGADPARFDEYERQIRAEYAWVPEPVFRARRRAVLEQFLARERLYGTPPLAALLERPARENLARSIARLAA